MGIKERKQRERDERRSLILNAANEIIAEEGLEGLSVRKIADRIEYSPGIIYHYFENKDDILQNFLIDKYQEIVNELRSVEIKTHDPEIMFKEIMKSYTKWAMKNREIYRIIMFNDSPGVLEYTSVLCQGATGKRQAIKMLAQAVKTFINDPEKDDEFFELRAQVIWTSSFGLIIRMIIEDIPEEQQERFIAGYVELITNGLRAGKTPLI
ncbi:MAG: hypothetical protein VR69_10490 [Peptococcaceae bacterium BRH_c4b]|nr:MAG: hypothetical protein VR69_10490 [Peptococcaceae bacterium BRH_c4b]